MGRLSFDLVRNKVQGKDCECNSNLFEDNEDQNDILSGKKLLRQYETSKKMYLLFFISTTVVTCFCIFVVVPQLIDYFTSVNAVSNSNDSEKQSVINLLDVERSRRNQERLEIMEKFDTLQQSYKLLKIEYEKAKENYMKKLQNAQEDEEKIDPEVQNVGTQSTYTFSENDILEDSNNVTESSDTNQDILANKFLHSLLVK